MVTVGSRVRRRLLEIDAGSRRRFEHLRRCCSSTLLIGKREYGWRPASAIARFSALMKRATIIDRSLKAPLRIAGVIQQERPWTPRSSGNLLPLALIGTRLLPARPPTHWLRRFTAS